MRMCSYTECCNLKSGLIPELKLRSRNILFVLVFPPHPSSPLQAATKWASVTIQFSFSFPWEHITQKQSNQDKVKKPQVLQIHILTKKFYCANQREPSFHAVEQCQNPHFNKRQKSYFPRAKHSSLTDEPFAAYVVSGKRTSIFGSYSPITPVEHQNSQHSS